MSANVRPPMKMGREFPYQSTHDARASCADHARIVAAIAAGLIGPCLATLFGSTIAPVAALLGAVVVQWVAGLITLLIGAAPWMIRLLPDNNLNAFVSGHFETSYYEIGPSGAEIERQVEIGLGQASLYLGCLLVAAVASALWSFTRREVR